MLSKPEKANAAAWAGILANDDTLLLLANDIALTQVIDSTFDVGWIGLAVQTYDDESVEIAFDNLDIWELNQ